MLTLLPNALQFLISSILWARPEPALEFQLRLSHALSGNTSRNVFTDVPSNLLAESFTFQPRYTRTFRASSQDAYNAARLKSYQHFQSDALLEWDEEELNGPDVTSRETLLLLAKMTNNAYFEPGEKGWYDLGNDWNSTFPYGWEPDQDGFRGHIFVSTDESTVIVSIKGTSVPIIGGGPTTGKDKLNDNLLFSCCCAKVGPTWSTVCGCHEGGWKCNQNCVERSLVKDSLFYSVGINLYNNITYMYPNSNIWLIGHSLGGSLASLIGTTFGAPVVAFEAPGDRMAARRLHLPIPPSTEYITHVFNTGDPIPMGQCTGVSSACASGGYALESQCHLGKIIKYDTVTKLGWYSSVSHHVITALTESILVKDWEEGKPVPDAVPESEDCVDCFKWEML